VQSVGAVMAAKRRNTRRQPRDSGAVRQLPSGRYQAKVRVEGTYYGAPETFDTKLAAQLWLDKQNDALADGTWHPPVKAKDAPKPLTFADYAQTWMSQRALKPRTVEAYQHILDEHLVPHWGAVRIDRITVSKVKAWYATLDPDKPTMRAHTYGLLRTMLQTAYQDDLIKANPCRIRGGGQVKRTTKTIIPTAEQVQALADGMPSAKYRVMVLVAAWCGLRFGELTELRRNDVLFDGDTPVVIAVRRGVARVGSEYVVGTPKSEAGVRDVVIPPHIRPDLADYLKTRPAAGDVLLFPGSRNGSHMAPSSLYKPFYRVRESLKLESLRWHDLRHFSGTTAAQTGATLAEIMGRLGHSTSQAALRYQHVANGRDEAIAEAMSNVVPLRARTLR
jgi:integrase